MESGDFPSAPAPGLTLDTFFMQVEHKAYRFALYGLWDRDAALDAVQDSMLKHAECYAEKPPAEWPALFFTILRHRVLDEKRARLLQRARGFVSLLWRSQDDETTPAWERVAAPEAGQPEASFGTREQRIALERALKTLPSRQREVFLLREWQELSIKETAQVLGCSDGSVKQHHFRALQSLRKLLSEVWTHETR